MWIKKHFRKQSLGFKFIFMLKNSHYPFFLIVKVSIKNQQLDCCRVSENYYMDFSRSSFDINKIKNLISSYLLWIYHMQMLCKLSTFVISFKRITKMHRQYKKVEDHRGIFKSVWLLDLYSQLPMTCFYF
jgi:hypothetical protein